MLLSIFSVFAVDAVEIVSPIETVYYTGDISLLVYLTTTVESISYSLDGGNIILGCENCSSFGDSLSLGLGSHDIYVIASDTYNVATDVVEFSIEEEIIEENNTNTTDTDLGLEIISPESTIYGSFDIGLYVTSSETLSQILYALNSEDFSLLCTGCNSFTTTILAEEGENTVTVADLVAVHSEAFVAVTV